MKVTRVVFMGEKENEANKLFFKWMIDGEMITPFLNYLKSNNIEVHDKWRMDRENNVDDKRNVIAFGV